MSSKSAHPAGSLPADQALELWRGGLPLAAAALEYGPKRLLRLAKRYDALAGLEMTLRQQLQHVVPQPTWPRYDEEEAKLITRRREARLELQRILVEKLQRREVLSFGFQKTYAAAHLPTEVPAVLFNPRFADFNKSEFKGHRLHFVDVRVCMAARLFEGDNHKQPTVSGPAAEQALEVVKARDKGGRPSKRKLIIEAFKAMQSDGIQLLNLPIKDLAKAVRNFANGTGADEKGLSDETIREHLNDFRSLTRKPEI